MPYAGTLNNRCARSGTPLEKSPKFDDAEGFSLIRVHRSTQHEKISKNLPPCCHWSSTQQQPPCHVKNSKDSQPDESSLRTTFFHLTPVYTTSLNANSATFCCCQCFFVWLYYHFFLMGTRAGPSIPMQLTCCAKECWCNIHVYCRECSDKWRSWQKQNKFNKHLF